MLSSKATFPQWITLPRVTTNYLYSVYFPEANIGYVVGTGIILKTINGGANWSSVTSGTINTLYSVYFTSPKTGFVVGA